MEDSELYHGTQFSEVNSYISSRERKQRAYGIKQEQEVFLVSILMNSISV